MKPNPCTNGTRLPEPFNQKFDSVSGEETFSFYLDTQLHGLLKYTLKQPDAKRSLLSTACYWSGRWADTSRCIGIGVQPHPDGRIEIRLRFAPPWYWSQIVNANQHREEAGVPTAVNDGAVSSS
jgi:hypothetical protein